jgi:acetyl esterase/lipase
LIVLSLTLIRSIPFSALIHSPFISPAADSTSYFLNGPVSIAIPVSWLRWAWRAAFELDNDSEATEEIVAKGSNRAAWNKSKWIKSEACRNFLEPLECVPPGLGDKQGTRYIVAVCKADALYDEGVELAHKLKENGAQVTLVEANGTHVIGFDCDPVAKDALMEAWRNEIFAHEKLD